jgi:hypothetical protein
MAEQIRGREAGEQRKGIGSLQANQCGRNREFRPPILATFCGLKRDLIVFQGRAGTRYTIWYDEGDGDAVGIANSTALNPRLHNLIPLAKGTSSEYTIESGSELGIYLRKGTYARGHIQERR